MSIVAGKELLQQNSLCKRKQLPLDANPRAALIAKAADVVWQVHETTPLTAR